MLSGNRLNQIRPAGTVRDIWRALRRTCLLILELKGLREHYKSILSNKGYMKFSFLTFMQGVYAVIKMLRT